MSNKFFILVVASSDLLLIICVKAERSTRALKYTLFNRCTKLATFMANPYISNSVMD